MREGLKAVLVTVLFAGSVLAFFGFSLASAQSTPATTAPTVTVTVPPSVPTKTITVTVPPEVKPDNSGHGNAADRVRVTVTLPPVTIRPNPVRVTKTVQNPGSNKTVRVPGPTTTVINPGPTQTVTARPSPAPTATVTERNVTRTVTASPSTSPVAGQDKDSRGTVVPGGVIDFSDDKTSTSEVVVVGVGTLAAVGLMLGTLWLGYVLGWRAKGEKDNEALRGILD